MIVLFTSLIEIEQWLLCDTAFDNILFGLIFRRTQSLRITKLRKQ